MKRPVLKTVNRKKVVRYYKECRHCKDVIIDSRDYKNRTVNVYYCNLTTKRVKAKHSCIFFDFHKPLFSEE